MRLRTLAGALCTAVSLGGLAAATTASADVVNAGAVAVAPGAGLNGSQVGPQVFASNAGSITCTTSSLSGPIVAPNPNNGTPDDVEWSIHSWTYGNCTDTIPLATVLGVDVVNMPYGAILNSDGGETIVVPGVTYDVTIGGGITCRYNAASIAGGFDNTLSTFAFIGQPLVKLAGNALCPNAATYTGGYGPIQSAGVDVTIG